MVERYTAAIIQYRRVDPEDIPDVVKRREENLRRALASFKSLDTWNAIDPVKLVALPENVLRHEFESSTPQEQRVASAIEIPGPETDEFAEMARKYKCYLSMSLHERDPKYPGYFLNTAFIMNPKGTS